MAIELFWQKVFPSLFPFFLLSPFFIQYGFFDLIKKTLGPIAKKIFLISENSAYLFFMSIISGLPSSATNAKILYEEGYINKDEAFHTLLFSHFSNPIFIFSMISNKPLLILSAHYFSNIMIGILLRFHKTNHKNEKMKKKNEKTFFDIFTSSIKNSMENLLFILGVIVFFFMINGILDFPITHLLLELSQGLSYANHLSIGMREIACLEAFLLSFGGFSVHIQTYGILSDWHLSYFPYFCIRIFHGILAASIVFFLF